MKLEKKIRNMQIERTLIFHFDLQTLASVDKRYGFPYLFAVVDRFEFETGVKWDWKEIAILLRNFIYTQNNRVSP